VAFVNLQLQNNFSDKKLSIMTVWCNSLYILLNGASMLRQKFIIFVKPHLNNDISYLEKRKRDGRFRLE